MAIFNKVDATFKALELTKIAIESGFLAPTMAPNHGATGGKESAEFVGAFIKQLTEELESLERQ
ncbi:hypothetical protein [Paraburkholderia tropica]|uniref:hypothetical protein n=1 Tax=Paraburkholderia tropica TaxID=92647 RepID=UPI002AB73F54|nr:hypothetical protein [Paraburkholderia tropica]